MKKIFYVAAIAFLFFSCKKDHKQPGNTTKLYDVKFNVTGFSQSISSVNISTNGLKTNTAPSSPGYLTDLYYLVYDANGKIVTEVDMKSDSSSFGTLSDKLAAGTYSFFFIGSHGKLALGPDIGYSNNFFYDDGSSTPRGNWDDTFFKSLKLTVSSAGINQAITLNRIVGELQVTLLDNVPASAAKLKLDIDSEIATYRYYPITTDTTYAYTDPTGGNTIKSSVTYTIPTAAIGTSNFSVYDILLNTYKPFSVTITCLDASNNVIATKTVSNVRCQKNTRTILSGDLFGSETGFGVALNNQWDPTINYQQF